MTNQIDAVARRQNFGQVSNAYIRVAKIANEFDMQGEAPLPYHEYPAKATGNDKFDAYPGQNDWYETVKLNYGIDYQSGWQRYFNPVPDTWHKMLHILLFWAGKHIDDRSTAGRLSADRDPVGVAAERGGIFVYPVKDFSAIVATQIEIF